MGAVVTANGRTQRVALTGDTAVALEPVQTRRMPVRFEKAPDAPHVVVPEIALTGPDVTLPLRRQTPTGAVCGLGPVLYIDGREIATRVTGTMADVINGSPLELEACDKETGDPVEIDLGEGEHRLHATPTAEFEVIDLLASGAGLLDRPRSGRSASSAGAARSGPRRSPPVRRHCSRCRRTSTTAGSPRSTARSSRRCGSTAGSRAGCSRRGSRSPSSCATARRRRTT